MHGFIRAGDGWYGDADAMNSLRLDEIVFSRAAPQCQRLELGQPEPAFLAARR